MLIKKVPILLPFLAVSAGPSLAFDPFQTDQLKHDKSTVSYALADLVAATNGNLSLVPTYLENRASSFIDNTVSSKISDFLKAEKGVTEISITGISKKNPQVSGLILRPLSEADNGHKLTFIQSSLLYSDSRTTVNIGIGKRFLSENQKVIYGINAFYDHEFPHNHRRASIGGEIKTSVGEVSVNRYFSLSDWKLLKSGNEERALGGHDIELGVPLPYMPTTYFRLRNFEWYAYGSTANPKGTVYSISSRLNNNFSFEFGVNKTKNQPDQNFLQIAYRFNSNNSNESPTPFFSDTPYRLKEVNEKMYDKVRRENRIVKQVRAVGFSVEFTGV